jgi:hypothetical protein
MLKGESRNAVQKVHVLTIYSYESPADDVPEVQNFPLSKTRLNKSNIVYSDEHTLCVRIKEKTV